MEDITLVQRKLPHRFIFIAIDIQLVILGHRTKLVNFMLNIVYALII